MITFIAHSLSNFWQSNMKRMCNKFITLPMRINICNPSNGVSLRLLDWNPICCGWHQQCPWVLRCGAKLGPGHHQKGPSWWHHWDDTVQGKYRLHLHCTKTTVCGSNEICLSTCSPEFHTCTTISDYVRLIMRIILNKYCKMTSWHGNTFHISSPL